MASLKQKTVSGIKWVFGASLVQRIIAFGTTVVLARILEPADFGLFALAFVMIDGFSVFKSLGFDSALVRRKGDIALACNTAFFLIPTMGMFLFILLFFVAPFCAQSLGTPAVTNIIRVLAFVFVISCFGKVPQTILYRDMKFKIKTMAEMSGHISYAVIALSLAFNGFGVWSLVVAYVLRNLVQITIEWVSSGWKPSFEFDKEVAWDMFHFGKFILAGAIIVFLSRNLDNIVIGKYLGVEMLGYYAIARNLASFLALYFMNKVALVMYPAYSKIQDDKEAVTRVMLRAVRMISIIAFPFAFGVFLFAPDILVLVFGEKWLPATDVLRVLVWVGLLRSLNSAILPIFLARGKAKADFFVNSVFVVLFFILIIPFSIYFGLAGAGMALLISTIIAHIIAVMRIKKILQIQVSRIYLTMKLPLLCSAFLLIVGVAAKYLTVGFGGKFNVLISGGLAVLGYLYVMHISDRNLFNEIKNILFAGKTK